MRVMGTKSKSCHCALNSHSQILIGHHCTAPISTCVYNILNLQIPVDLYGTEDQKRPIKSKYRTGEYCEIPFADREAGFNTARLPVRP